MRVIDLHQNRPAHASKLTRCIVSYQQMLVNLFAYAGKLWMCKFTCLCGSVLTPVTSFLFWVWNMLKQRTLSIVPAHAQGECLFSFCRGLAFMAEDKRWNNNKKQKQIHTQVWEESNYIIFSFFLYFF